jgi:hypothetical protein
VIKQKKYKGNKTKTQNHFFYIFNSAKLTEPQKNSSTGFVTWSFLMSLIWMESSLNALQLSFRSIDQKTCGKAPFEAIFVARFSGQVLFLL